MSRKSPDLRAAAAPTLIDVARVASVSPSPYPAFWAVPAPRQEVVLLAAAPEHRTSGCRTAWLRQLRCVIFQIV